MAIRSACFHLHKAGNQAEDYEDGWAIADWSTPGQEMYRFAVADGATESSFSGEWARLLCRAYADGIIEKAPDDAILQPIREQWNAAIPQQTLPWYAEAKLEQGAFAALMGLTLTRDRQKDLGRAALLSVGDCCVFQVQSDGLRSFPAQRSDDFNARPILIGTNPTSSQAIAWDTRDWEFQRGDSFLLMSDALACWFLRLFETQNMETWMKFRSSVAQRQDVQGFQKVISEERAKGALKNDDVTMMLINTR